MDRHNLTRAAVDGANDEQDEAFINFDQQSGGSLDVQARYEVWRWSLAHGIANLHGCFVFKRSRTGASKFNPSASIEIVGRPSQVETVRYLFLWLTNEITRLKNEHGVGMGGVWRREFGEGAAAEIVSRLREQRKTTVATIRHETTDPHALMVVDHRISVLHDPQGAEAFIRSKMTFTNGPRRAQTQTNWTARQAGSLAARSLNLTTPSKRVNGSAVKQIGGTS